MLVLVNVTIDIWLVQGYSKRARIAVCAMCIQCHSHNYVFAKIYDTTTHLTQENDIKIIVQYVKSRIYLCVLSKNA